ncbi:hypothetical protein PoB_000269000 [Plakobranchus ocellatus]|uniref:Secreted protein n=1 Tax=Plakobranchus ocellatus TaxID=259542 RepID=A0AAV3XZU5_9GAST|nr:hypothetical protein PoB_000269000 [Plakobranchus ocellatus]
MPGILCTHRKQVGVSCMVVCVCVCSSPPPHARDCSGLWVLRARRRASVYPEFLGFYFRVILGSLRLQRFPIGVDQAEVVSSNCCPDIAELR